jgi:hypothetical protein
MAIASGATGQGGASLIGAISIASGTGNPLVDGQGANKTDMAIPEYLTGIFTEDEWHRALEKGRFFTIRSSNLENIGLSRDHSEWATTRTNQVILDKAYKDSEFVFLVFTATKTKMFQGIAVMTSAVSNKVGNYWITGGIISLGGCFKIQWATTRELPYARADHLKNIEGESVTKSKDCLEMEREVGKQLCSMFSVPFRDPATPSPLPPSFAKALVVPLPSRMDKKQPERQMRSVEIDKARAQEFARERAEKEKIDQRRMDIESVAEEMDEFGLLARKIQRENDPTALKIVELLGKGEGVAGDRLRKALAILSGEELPEHKERPREEPRDRPFEKDRSSRKESPTEKSQRKDDDKTRPREFKFHKINKSDRKDVSVSDDSLRYKSDDSDSGGSDYRKGHRDSGRRRDRDRVRDHRKKGRNN